MVYVVVLLWLILGLTVFFVAMRRGSRRGGVSGAAGGGEGLPPESKASRRLTVLGVVVMVAFGLAIPALVLASNGNHKASQAVGGVHLNAAQTKGRELFAHSCVYCHSLAAVRSYARTGPDLDVRVGEDISTNAGRRALVLNAILEGRARGNGQMPALLYQGKEAEDVAAFVAAVAGR